MTSRSQLLTQLDEYGQTQTHQRPLMPGPLLASIVAAAVCLLSSCVSLETPYAGQPVVIPPGRALVFGRIRMFDVKIKNTEYAPFRFDPYDQPFAGPGPRMTLELRQLLPLGGLYKYKAYPAAPVEPDGSFYWILSAGDYELLGNPRLLGSRRFSPADAISLARFSVAASGQTIDVCTLIIDVIYDFVDFLRAWKTDEAEYVVQSLRVMDERGQILKLHERFPALPEPVITECMRTE
jgi:hypothetical protein